MQRRAPPGCYWRGKILWARATVAGQEHRWSLGTDDPADAKRRRKARHDRLRAEAKYGEKRLTWDDAVLAWAPEIASNVAANTLKRYGVSLAQVSPMLKGCYLDEIDKGLIADVISQRRAKGAANATIRRDLGAISSVLGFCEANDWIASNPAMSAMRRVKERRDPIILPEPRDIEAVIARAPGLLSAMIRAAWQTGCRQEELASLDRSRLDMRHRQATIVGKGNKLRTIDLLDAYETLRGLPANLASRFVFWHGAGEPYANVASRFAEMTRSAQKAAQKKGQEFRRFRFHDLRHRFAVDYLKGRRGSIYDLQLHLGHGSVKITELYLKYLTPEEVRMAKERSAR